LDIFIPYLYFVHRLKDRDGGDCEHCQTDLFNTATPACLRFDATLYRTKWDRSNLTNTRFVLYANLKAQRQLQFMINLECIEGVSSNIPISSLSLIHSMELEQELE